MGKAREFPKNSYFCFIDCAKIFDCANHTKLWKFLKRQENQITLPVSWETCVWVKKHSLNWTWNNGLVQNWEGSMTRLYVVTLLISLTCRVHHVKFWATWITSYNQDCQEKYQQPKICRWHHSSDQKWRGTKEPLDEGERGEWKSWFRTQCSKMKIMASGLITSWQIEGGKVETVTDFIFLVSKITVDGDCTHEIKRCLLFVRKVMTSLDCVLESRNITLPTKVNIVKTMVYPQRRQWHPTLVLLPGKFHGQRSLVGCSPWGR